MPRIAVITPYYREPLDYLEQCHKSVLAQDIPADHFMVADGHPRTEVAQWNVRHVVLPCGNGDGGSVPRGVGSILADAQGYDFIAYLDADNWWDPRHLSSLVGLHSSSRAPVCTSFRTFHMPDGTSIAVTERDEDVMLHVDTSCFLLHRAAFALLPIWTRMPATLGPMCDRVFMAGIRKHRFPMASTRLRTVAYRTLYEAHYRGAGLPLPPGFKSNEQLNPAMEWMLKKEGVDTCVEQLGFWPPTFF